ncbi:MAG: hypothetical protein ACXVQR_03550 [Solirubrobacteraceae bacterium]
MERLEVRPVPVRQTRPLRQAVLRPHESVEQVTSREPDEAFAVGAFEAGVLVSVGLIGPDGAGAGVSGAWPPRVV